LGASPPGICFQSVTKVLPCDCTSPRNLAGSEVRTELVPTVTLATFGTGN